MTEPVVFVSRFRIKEGKLDGLKKQFRKVMEMLEAEKPRTTAQLAYLDDTGTEAEHRSCLCRRRHDGHPLPGRSGEVQGGIRVHGSGRMVDIRNA
jgi:hypothetical protein